MSVLPPFDLVRPHDLESALEAISSDYRPYAGGTELLLAMRAGLIRPAALVDLKQISNIRVVTIHDDILTIGGAATHRTVARSPEARSSLPVLSDVLERVGNVRVRSVGTIGGNLCFAEPKSDVAAVLTALEADVELTSTGSKRRVKVADFVLGPYTADLEDDELLTTVSIPLVAGRKVVYDKFQTMERPTVGVAAVEEPEGSRRVVVGAVGGRPETFEVPADGSPEEIASRVEVIPDLTGGERYKRHIVAVMVTKALRRLGGTS